MAIIICAHFHSYDKHVQLLITYTLIRYLIDDMIC